MTDFDHELALAMVGTGRGQLSQLTGPLAQQLGDVHGDAESQLLGRAALLGLVRFAGQTATTIPDLPEPAPAENRAAAPACLARHLDPQGALLPEWLHLCAQAGWLVPPAQLPTLLDFARHRAELRELLRPVLGERGVWLSQFNPEWRFTSRAFSEEEWLEAGEAEKESLFRSLLAVDRAAARDWLAVQWTTERARVKKRMLSALLFSFDATDKALEPLLDGALTDRSSEVQELVRTALMRIPQSAYNARMAARLLPERDAYLKKTDSKRDADWKKDGLDSKATAKDALQALLETTHPDAVMQALERTPEALVEWAKTLGVIKALVTSTIRTQDLPLAKALLAYDPHHLELMKLAAPGQMEGYLLAELAKGNSSPQRLQEIAEHLPAPLPKSVASPLLQQVRERCQATKYADAYAWSSFATWLAQNIDPATPLPAELNAPFELADAQDFSEYGRRSFNDALALLKRRAEMHRDFAAAKAETGS